MREVDFEASHASSAEVMRDREFKRDDEGMLKRLGRYWKKIRMARYRLRRGHGDPAHGDGGPGSDRGD